MSFPIAFSEVLRARNVARAHLPRTPLRNYRYLDQAVGAQVWVKHENHLPTNTFKVRGGLYLMSRLDEAERRRGVVTATRGNHGQSLAWAGALHGVPVTVVVPEGNNPEKNEAMRGLGAELIVHGRDYDAARERCEQLVAERGVRYVHATNEPDLIAGVATYTLEILEDAPDLEVLLCPVGGGSQCAGALLVARAVRPDLEVIAVQAERAPAVYRSWKAGAVCSTSDADTCADGLATRFGYQLTLSFFCSTAPRGLDDFVLVDEEELRQAARLLLRATHNLVEPAGAAAAAGAYRLRERLRGRKVGLVLSGSNIDEMTLRWILSADR